MEESRIILAADELTLDQCLELAPRIGNRVYAIKIHNLRDRHGPEGIKHLKSSASWLLWDDSKLKDIPNTVKLRARAIKETGADIISVHASGEIDMMMAAKESGALIYAVTVLTSLTEEEAHLLHGQPTKAAVLYQARLAKLAGMDGVVCSPQEIGVLAKRRELQGLDIITPGIRPAGTAAGDQKRFDTPSFAIKAGAKRLVIGRALTLAADPVAALDAIENEIAASQQ